MVVVDDAGTLASSGQPMATRDHIPPRRAGVSRWGMEVPVVGLPIGGLAVGSGL